MTQATRFSLDQLAGRATVTIEQTAQILGLGRTAAYDAARRDELRRADLGDDCSCRCRPSSSG